MRLLKSLYGVVDSGRNFYEEWVHYHLELGFQPIHSDKCYLMFYISESEYIRLCFHVDDNIIAQSGTDLWEWYQAQLRVKYALQIKPLRYCMGVEFAIDYEHGTVRMTQVAQIDRMLRDLKISTKRSPVSSSHQPDL